MAALEFVGYLLLMLVVILVAMYLINGGISMFGMATGCEGQNGVCKESCGENERTVIFFKGCPPSDDRADKEKKHCCAPQKEDQEGGSESDAKCKNQNNGYACGNGTLRYGNRNIPFVSMVCLDQKCVPRCDFCARVLGSDTVCNPLPGVNQEVTFTDAFSCRAMESPLDCDALNLHGDCIRGFCPGDTYCAKRDGNGARDGELYIRYSDQPEYCAGDCALPGTIVIVGDPLRLTVSYSGPDRKLCAVDVLREDGQANKFVRQFTPACRNVSLDNGPCSFRWVFECGGDAPAFVLENDPLQFLVNSSEYELLKNVPLRIDVIAYNCDVSDKQGNVQTSPCQDKGRNELAHARISLDLMKPSSAELRKRNPIITIASSNPSTKSCIVTCKNSLGEQCGPLNYLGVGAGEQCGENLNWEGNLPTLAYNKWNEQPIDRTANPVLCFRGRLTSNPLFVNYTTDPNGCERFFYQKVAEEQVCLWNSCAQISDAAQCEDTLSQGCSFSCIWDNVKKTCRLCSTPETQCKYIRDRAACDAAAEKCGMQCHWRRRFLFLPDTCEPGPRP
ncbi:MAG: hypothetical protein V1725_06270 [archaeon]